MKLFLMYNTGNSGGSWMEGVINSNPRCLVLEEPRRKLGLPKIGADFTMEQLQARLFDELHRQEHEGKYESFGFIKGFRDEMVQYVLEHGGSVTQQTRHPIRVIHGTRKRHIKAKRYWGREPVDEVEEFQGRVRQMVSRYEVFVDRAELHPLYRLEDLMLSLQTGAKWVFREVLEEITQVQWSRKDIERAAQVRPRHRLHAPLELLWDPDYEEDPDAPWESRSDPPVAAIWEHWEKWQRVEFAGQFKEVCNELFYEIPEV